MNKKILVIDDQLGWCEVIKEVLGSQEYDVYLAQNKERAMSYLSSCVFDLIVLDIRLQEEAEYNTEGIIILNEMRAREINSKVIALTGHATPALIQKMEWQGVFRVLEKTKDGLGFDMEVFLDTVKLALGT